MFYCRKYVSFPEIVNENISHRLRVFKNYSNSHTQLNSPIYKTLNKSGFHWFEIEELDQFLRNPQLVYPCESTTKRGHFQQAVETSI